MVRCHSLCRSKDGETALHVSAIRGSLETVQALLDAGAYVDARTPTGSTIHMTPSMWAVYHAHDEMVEMLLEAGADPTAADENGKALLTMAQEAQQPKIVKLLQARLALIPAVPGLPAVHWLLNRVGSAAVEGAVLTMVAGKETDWFNPPPGPASPAALANAPALVFTPRAAEWQLSARVHVAHASLFDAATLFVYQSPQDWCKLCFEYSPERRPTVVSVVTRGISDDANGPSFEAGASSVLLRVSRYSAPAGIFAFHYSIDDGKYWTLHRIFTLRDPDAPVSVGMLAQAPTGESCTARFSEVTFTETALANPRNGS